MQQDWASKFEQEGHFGFDAEDCKTIPILRDLVAAKDTPATTASRVAAFYEARLKAGNNDIPYTFWVLVCEIIAVHGADKAIRERVTQLLLSLTQIIVLDAAGKPIVVPELDNAYWSELPGYTLAFRDRMHCIPPTDIMADDDEEWEDWQRRFTNGNVFQAEWLANVANAGPAREHASARNYAVWNLGGALEPGIADTPLGYRRTEMWIPQAAQWILIAGPCIWQLCRDNYRNDGSQAQERAQEDGAVSGYTFTGPEWFSVERWQWWRTRFTYIAGLAQVTAEVREWATKAAARMQEIGHGDL
ncbi:hypothetical protein SLS58_001471 [Diplodia intermedia]|uniref:Uncharacterized protein n=1 Tax=Diplodia intermedia TaxID=856260 RepID=A0ABR3U222_9PEZI